MDMSDVSSQSFVVLEVSFAEVAVKLGVEPLSDDLVDLDPDVVPVDVSVGSVLDSKPPATPLAHERSLVAVTFRDVREENFLRLVIKLTIPFT